MPTRKNHKRISADRIDSLSIDGPRSATIQPPRGRLMKRLLILSVLLIIGGGVAVVVFDFSPVLARVLPR